MKIAIIGAGNVGRALAMAARRAGHDVVISAAHKDHADAAALESGARAAASNGEAVRGAELVVFAVPAAAVEALAVGMAGELDGKAVIDVTNRPTPDPSGAPGASIAESLQQKLPKAHVVKAFNTAFASRQAEPVVDGVTVDGYVAGDDAEAKRSVLELVGSLGFRPIDVGPLVMARTLEAMAWLNINLQLQNKWPWQAGWKLVGPTT